MVDLQKCIQSAIKRLVPVWPLSNCTLINPLAGWMDRPFLRMVYQQQLLGHIDLLPSFERFKELSRLKIITRADLDAVRGQVPLDLLFTTESIPIEPLRTPLCYCDERLYKELVKDPPKVDVVKDPLSALQALIEELDLDDKETILLFDLYLSQISGWSGLLPLLQEKHDSKDHTFFIEWLATRLYLAVHYQADAIRVAGLKRWRVYWKLAVKRWEGPIPFDLTVRYIWQQALEKAYARQLLEKLEKNSSHKCESKMLAAFCMDPRSEKVRRHLEEQVEDCCTLGVAGNFGCSVNEAHDSEEMRLLAAERAIQSFNVKKWPHLFVLIGHKNSHTTHAFSASYQCGACGGQGGGNHARKMASILNDPLVKEKFGIDRECYFIAGVHDTSNDTVEVFESEGIPKNCHDLVQRLKNALDILPTTTCDKGLVGNYALLVADRRYTRTCNLEGKVFLHSFSKNLTNLFEGPLKVAHWINLQYYAAHFAPHHFGCNRRYPINVSDLEWDLECSGVDLTEEQIKIDPVRLQIFIDTSAQALADLLNGLPEWKERVRNGWCVLHALQL